MKQPIIVGLDAKRIVRNGTGLGSYGRTLATDLSAFEQLDLRLYAPDKGRDDLRLQVPESNRLHVVYPDNSCMPQALNLVPLAAVRKAYWRSRGIVNQLKADGIQVFHGLSGELPVGIRKAGVKTVVTIHDLIFMRHPEYYNWIDVQIYKQKFFQALREADRIVAISECTRRDISELGSIRVVPLVSVGLMMLLNWSVCATSMSCPSAMCSVWALLKSVRIRCWLRKPFTGCPAM